MFHTISSSAVLVVPLPPFWVEIETSSVAPKLDWSRDMASLWRPGAPTQATKRPAQDTANRGLNILTSIVFILDKISARLAPRGRDARPGQTSAKTVHAS